jgi:hypothetical protein
MSKRVISECVTVRVNVGNFQHIEITKQFQEEIEYTSDEGRLELEEQLSKDVVDSVINSMRLVPGRLGKGVDNAQEVEDSISKAIPEWLNNAPPNLANNPKINSDKVAAAQKDNKDKVAESSEIAESSMPTVESNDFLDDRPTVESNDFLNDADLFEDELVASEPIEVAEVKELPSETVETVEAVEEKKEVVVAQKADIDFFDDDDFDFDFN